MIVPPDPRAADLIAAPAELPRSVPELEAAGDVNEAMAEAWRAADDAPHSRAAKRVLADFLHRWPGLCPVERGADLRRLLDDPEVDPIAVAPAGWRLVLRQGPLAASDEPERLARWLEDSELARVLLRSTYVAVLDAETALTRLRRWLLLSNRSSAFPRLVEALAAQTEQNGGAWLLEPDEAERLDTVAGEAIAAAYRPAATPSVHRHDLRDATTRAVAEQYENWPYPAWSRITAPSAQTLPQAIEALDAGRASDLPVDGAVLVAGCGTGREAATMAMRFPDAHVTAIDISEMSLTYAEQRCRGLDIDFRLLDLHRASELGRRFDLISCCGVLHHLPDPEAGWGRLVEALKPGGVMRVKVYSKIARLRMKAARATVADLLDRPVDADLLRTVRRRLIDKVPGLLGFAQDFYHLAGIHDLVLHRHEDPFDVPRIAGALDRLGLELLAFSLPTDALRVRYRREHPEDPLLRDMRIWASLERSSPFLFSSMYGLWCRKAVMR